ncbi:MAG: hypothetical protein AABO58_07205 [Acidobacteriota bacterium]
MRSLAVFTLALLCSSLAAADSPWKATLLLSIGEKLPDEGAQVQEIGPAFWCPPDMTVAWVRTGQSGAPGAWAIVSVKQGQVKTVIREASDAVSKYAAPDVKPMRVSYGSKWVGTTGVIPARGRAFIFAREPYLWDGQKLRTIASRGTQIKVGPTTYTVGGMAAPSIAGVYDEGSVLMNLPIAAPRKTAVLAIFDGQNFTPLMVDGDPLQGLPQVRMDTSVYDLPGFVAVPGGAFALMRVAGAPYRYGLFWAEPGKVELIAAYGRKQESVLGPQKETSAIRMQAAASRDVYAILAQDGKTLFFTLLVKQKGEYKTPLPPPEKGGSLIYPGVFVGSEAPAYLFHRNGVFDGRIKAQIYSADLQKVFLRTEREKEMTPADRNETYRPLVVDEFWFIAGGEARRLEHPESSLRIGGEPVSYRKISAPYAGVLISRSIPQDEADAMAKVLPELWRAFAARPTWFFAEGSDAITLAPRLTTDAGEIGLEQVVGFADASHGVAVTPKGIVALSR